MKTFEYNRKELWQDSIYGYGRWMFIKFNANIDNSEFSEDSLYECRFMFPDVEQIVVVDVCSDGTYNKCYVMTRTSSYEIDDDSFIQYG